MVMLVKWVLHWSGAGEEGQFGTYVQPTTALSQAALETAVNSVVDNFAAGPEWAIHLRALLGTDQAYDHVSAYMYPDGLAPASVSAVGNIGNAQGVGTGASLTPLQSAIVVSLETGHSGASYRGRLYVPLTGQGLSTGHQLDPSICDNTASAIAGAEAGDDHWLSVISEATESGAAPAVVFSRTKNLATPITSVRVDSRSDTQRRRANSQVALHTTNRTLTSF